MKISNTESVVILSIFLCFLFQINGLAMSISPEEPESGLNGRITFKLDNMNPDFHIKEVSVVTNAKGKDLLTFPLHVSHMDDTSTPNIFMTHVWDVKDDEITIFNLNGLFSGAHLLFSINNKSITDDEGLETIKSGEIKITNFIDDEETEEYLKDQKKLILSTPVLDIETPGSPQILIFDPTDMEGAFIILCWIHEEDLTCEKEGYEKLTKTPLLTTKYGDFQIEKNFDQNFTAIKPKELNSLINCTISLVETKEEFNLFHSSRVVGYQMHLLLSSEGENSVNWRVGSNSIKSVMVHLRTDKSVTGHEDFRFVGQCDIASGNCDLFDDKDDLIVNLKHDGIFFNPQNPVDEATLKFLCTPVDSDTDIYGNCGLFYADLLTARTAAIKRRKTIKIVMVLLGIVLVAGIVVAVIVIIKKRGSIRAKIVSGSASNL